MSMSVGLGNGSTSANIATANTEIMQPIAIQNSSPSRRPRRAGACATPSSMPSSSVAMTDPWIEDGVEHVDEEVHQHESCADQQHHALQDDEVARTDRTDKKPTNSRQRKNRLHNHRATDQPANVDSGDGDERER